jgi:hypothetical protein
MAVCFLRWPTSGLQFANTISHKAQAMLTTNTTVWQTSSDPTGTVAELRTAYVEKQNRPTDPLVNLAAAREVTADHASNAIAPRAGN